jgi:hypothetical protein
MFKELPAFHITAEDVSTADNTHTMSPDVELLEASIDSGIQLTHACNQATMYVSSLAICMPGLFAYYGLHTHQLGLREASLNAFIAIC